ncbi:thiosulfate sulfurtransferase [Subtercola lobariae]|uniref:Thiosulfate sulfurtransferase n=1 Tax=Subtercola lobariae TaxID=1588641 RepID=A0A917B7U5_9MICO|nr:thiosulfate sulfurtransferase [Subtercola lobariae]
MSTQWLCDHIGSDSIVVLDATVLSVLAFGGDRVWLSGLDEYLVNGHIPGALFADVIETLSDPDRPFGFARPSAERFSAAVTQLGIGPSTTVIVYDNSLGQWAARVWWLFRSFGHDQVAVLDGGLTKWNLEDRPTETGYVEPTVALEAFVAEERHGFWVEKPFVEDVVAGRVDALLLCALPPKEFSGETGSRERRGHIPGSVNVAAGRLVDPETHAMLPKSALRGAFAAVLEGRADGSRAAADDRIVVYCGGGIAAAADALALAALGEYNVAVYDGSLNEWSADPAAPLLSL